MSAAMLCQIGHKHTQLVAGIQPTVCKTAGDAYQDAMKCALSLLAMVAASAASQPSTGRVSPPRGWNSYDSFNWVISERFIGGERFPSPARGAFELPMWLLSAFKAVIVHRSRGRVSSAGRTRCQ